MSDNVNYFLNLFTENEFIQCIQKFIQIETNQERASVRARARASARASASVSASASTSG